MINAPHNADVLARGKLQEIIDRAVDSGADSVTIEFAKGGGLEVFFVFESAGFGDILVDASLQNAVMTGIKTKRPCIQNYFARSRRYLMRRPRGGCGDYESSCRTRGRCSHSGGGLAQ